MQPNGLVIVQQKLYTYLTLFKNVAFHGKKRPLLSILKKSTPIHKNNPDLPNKTTHTDMGARRNFSRGGGQTFGEPPKICEGGSHNISRQALKYAYRGGGLVLMPAKFFSRGPQVYKGGPPKSMKREVC